MSAPALAHPAATPAVEPLLGRDEELQRALGASQEAERARRLGALLLRGAEGSGKSHLLQTLLASLGQPERVTRVSFAPGEPPPAHGLDRLVRSVLGLGEELSGAPLLAALRASLAEGPDADPDGLRAEFLAFVLGVSAPDFRSARMDAKSRWEGAFAELKRLLERRVQKAGAPWVWVLEDAERGDLQTADFLDWALPLKWEAPLLLVLTLRSGGDAAEPGGSGGGGSTSAWEARAERWRKLEAVVDVPLAPLPTAQLSRLVQEMAAGALSAAQVARVTEHARGNPLFARELVGWLKGASAASPALAAGPLPAGLLQALDAQLSRLPAPALELLRRAATVGPRIPFDALAHLAPEASTEALEQLVAAGLVTRMPSLLVPGTVDVVFTRAPLHEAALARSNEQERQGWLQRLEGWASARLALDAARWGGAEVQLAGLLVRALSGRGAASEASLWLELIARVHLRHQRRPEALRALRAAMESATGTRRVVLQRRLGEEENVAGESQRALATFAARPASFAPPSPLPSALVARVAALIEDPLERWDSLSVDEASISLELARSEALSHIGKSEDTAAAFSLLEARLKRLQGGAAPYLWTRWARTWSWFLAELLGRPRDALRVCEQVRARPDVQAAGLDRTSEALLRAEQVAASRTGEMDRARQLADAQLELARARGNLADEVVVWNARAIIHMSVGDLEKARRGFDTSAEMARSIGFKRREAIALHNLGIALLEQGDSAGARSAQLRYMEISRDIGNKPASAYGPASLAAGAVAERDWPEVDRQLAEARAVAEANKWPFILAWARGLAGRARLLRWVEGQDALLLKQAKGDLLACLDALEERGSAWTEELDPGEYHVTYALVECALDAQVLARQALQQGRRLISRSCAVSHAWLDVGEALVEGRPVAPALSWFSQRGHARALLFVEAMQAALN
ncbi:AAA family ATPase [Aggregicoccus sp. 17bor-14]|uniref:tetratricopeptide repeat protein n=1 Tax=Myxococcaceae TaxID=31 RepID=UPI00129C418B|nr:MULTISPECIES: tetratricopeptide repeat protein [Myxococcaceae]MBF5042365.1 AAA family ATPase [Simulacricoccus sp. 17bor-14]MRI88138.1 AAA family ATPase [Aggregicoccus sp. 17bor-14]